MKSICVYCGSNMGRRPIYHETAKRVGELIAGKGLRLIYGGANRGLMGIVADTVLSNGGEVVGIIPEALANLEVAHYGVTELIITSSMHERKLKMAEMADGFIAMPGGFGTFEEICEALTWAQLGIHYKPCGLLNTGGFYNPLLQMFDSAVEEHFMPKEHRSLVLSHDNPEQLLESMFSYKPEKLQKWLSK